MQTVENRGAPEKRLRPYQNHALDQLREAKAARSIAHRASPEEALAAARVLASNRGRNHGDPIAGQT